MVREPAGNRALGASGTDALLSHVDASRRLTTCQLAIETWLTDWRRAAQV